MHAFAPEPQIERDIGVAGRAREIVIVGNTARNFAALRLNGDDRLAAPDRGEMKRAA